MSFVPTSVGMRLTRNIRMLTRHSAWANDRLYCTLAALPEGEPTARRPMGFGNMVSTLNHAYVVDLIWQAHLQVRPHGFTSRITEEEPSLQALRSAQAKVDQWYIAYSDALSEEAHDQ